MECRGTADPAGHRRVHRRRPARDVRPRGRRGGADRPGSDADAAFAESPYLDYAELERALRACRADAVWPGWGFVSEKAEFAELCDRLGITFIGPSAEVMRRLGDKIESKRLAEQAGVPLAPWSGGPVADLAAGPQAGRVDRLPADGQGDRGRRRPRHPAGAIARGPRRGLRTGQLRGVEDGRGRDGLPRAGDPRRPACRGAGCRRRRGHRVDAGRPGLQRAAAQPEGHRGVRLDRAGRRAGEAAALARRRTRPGGRVRQRRDGGVPLRAQPAAAVLPRGQHPAAGRAPGHRGHHRRRHRQAAAAHRGGRHAGRDRPGRAAGLRARHRGQAYRRGPGARLRARPRPDRASRPAGRPGHQGRHRGGAGRRHPAAVRLHDREGDRLGPGPLRSPRQALPRAPADRHGDQAAGPLTRRSCSTCWTGLNSCAARSTRPGWMR